MASRLVQLFCTGDQSVPILYNGTPLSPPNCPFPWGDIWATIQCMVPLALTSPQSKRQLDRCSRFAELTSVTDRPTNRPTDRLTHRPCYSVGNISRIYVRSTSTAMWPNNNNK